MGLRLKISLLLFWSAFVWGQGRFNDCALAKERIVLTTDASTRNVVLSPQDHETHTPWVPRAKFQSDRGRLIVEVVGDDMIRFEWDGERGLPADDQPIYSSPLVAKKVHEGATRLDVRDNGTVFETPNIIVRVDPNNLSFTVFDKRRNKQLTTVWPEELRGDYKKFHVDNSPMNDPYLHGVAAKPRDGDAFDTGWTHQTFTAPNPYGNGMTIFDRGGAPTTSVMPVFFFHKEADNYALFVDETTKVEGFFSGPNHGSIGMTGRYPAMYLITGANIPEVHRSFMDLRGRQAMPPRDMFGFGLSKFGYENWQQVFDDLRGMEQAGFPLPSTVWLDLQWFGESFYLPGKSLPSDSEPSRMGSVKWDERGDKFPNPQDTMNYLKSKGITPVLISESYVADHIPDAGHMAEKGYFVKNPDGSPVLIDARPSGFWKFKAYMMDWTNPEARQYWFDTRLLPLARMGMHRYWFDLGDPEMYSANGRYRGADGQGNLHYENHNIYNNMWVRMVEEGYERHGIRERPVVISRAMNIGTRQMNWSGDATGSPPSLEAHLRDALNVSFGGQNYYSRDTGGFWRRDPDWRYEQFFTRDLVTSLLGGEVPSRVHVFNIGGENKYRPDTLGEKDSNLAALRERNAIVPYLYSLAYDAHLTGAPIRSTPAYYNQQDTGLPGMSQFIIGRNDILVAPSIDYDENARDVRLPQGNRWIDMVTHQEYEGGQTLPNVSSRKPDGTFQMPMFARSGLLMPRTEQSDPKIGYGDPSVKQINHDFIVRAFPGNGDFKLYEDDGVTNDFKSGRVRTTEMTQVRNGWNDLAIEIKPSQGDYDGAPSERRYRVEVAADNLNVEKVEINDHALTQCWDKADFDANWTEGYYIDGATKLVHIKTGNMPVSWNKRFTVKFR